MGTLYCHNHTDVDGEGIFGTIAILNSSSTLFGVVGDVMGSGAPGASARLIIEAGATIGSEQSVPREWPDRLASAVAQRVGRKIEGDPRAVIFCALGAASEMVHVCTAGDIRVHLLRDGEILQSTRDHVLGNESPEWVREKYGDINVDDHATMLTRTIGMCSMPPTHETWRLRVPFTILVCSAEYHRHRPHRMYVQNLLDVVTKKHIVPNQGLLTRIDVER